MKKILLLSLFLMFLAGLDGTLLAQDRTVTGRVTTADDGASIPGANVLVKGTTTGATTDANGRYSISVPDNATLVFSFIGLESQEVAVGSRTTVDVRMTSDVKGLTEVVVVGYGTQNRKDLTGSVASISGDQIRTAPVQSFDQALQGRAAGVNITTPNGVLNNPPVIRVRGVNSINLSSQPLIVIDGVPTFSGDQSNNSAANNPLANLNPADIESIEVLKDASASAIYGSRASAGVLLITTKRGKEGKTSVNYDGWVGATQAFRLFDLLNAQEYMDMKNEASRNANLQDQFFPSYDNNGDLIDTDWYDQVYQTGISHNHNLSFNGGTPATKYYLSLGYTGQEGMLKQNTFDRMVGRLNLDHKLFDNFTVGSSINYSNSVSRAPNTGSVANQAQAFGIAGLGRLPLVLPPNVAPYLNDGTYNINTNNQIGQMANTAPATYYNPVPLLDKNKASSEGNQIQANVYANWQVVKGLNLRTSYGIDRLQIENMLYLNPDHGDGGGATGGLATNIYGALNRWNWQGTAQYDFKLGEGNSFSLLGGTEQQSTKIESWGAQRTLVADPLFTTYQGNFVNIVPVGNFQGENYLISYFGRLNYDFKDKYFVSASLRTDGYSAFAVGKKWGTFYGGAVGYSISEEPFWKNSSLSNVFNFLKLRASYGLVGNNNGLNDFGALSLYNSGPYGSKSTFFYFQAGNANLSWETSKKTDVGLNFGFFNDRIQGELTYYQNIIDGLVLSVPIAPSKGVPGNSLLSNVGSMENKGVEFSVKYNAIRKTDFDWTVSFNVTTQDNVVTELASGNSDIVGITSGLEQANITRVGQPVGSLYVVETRGVNSENGQRVFVKSDGTLVQYNHVPAAGQSRWTKVEDGTATTAPNTAADGKVYGPTIPTWYGGLDNTFRYKGIDLGVFLQFSGGNYLYNGTKAGLRDQRFWNNHTDVLNRWTPDNPGGTIPRLVWLDNVSNGSSFPISENVEKGDFLRVRNVALGYSLPQTLLSKVKLSRVRVYAQVQNAALLTNYTGIDPEISTNGASSLAPGVDRNSVGQGRTYTLGLNIGL